MPLCPCLPSHGPLKIVLCWCLLVSTLVWHDDPRPSVPSWPLGLGCSVQSALDRQPGLWLRDSVALLPCASAATAHGCGVGLVVSEPQNFPPWCFRRWGQAPHWLLSEFAALPRFELVAAVVMTPTLSGGAQQLPVHSAVIWTALIDPAYGSPGTCWPSPQLPIWSGRRELGLAASWDGLEPCS